MAHPFHHAVSSAKKFGGEPGDYLAIHSWFDASKAHFADARHRALRHHKEGVDLAAQIFAGSAQDRLLGVPVSLIGEQHVTEDLGIVVSASDWFHALEPSPWMRAIAMTAIEQAERSVERWGGSAIDYLPVHAFIDASEDLGLDPERHRALRHHAEGIFVCETLFGVVIRNARRREIPTRWIAEQHVKTELGRIPTAADWLRRIPMRPWMNQRLPAEVRVLSRA